MRAAMNDYKKYGDYSAGQSSKAESARTAITFLLIGAGIGALFSLLLAPKSGSELRQTFRDILDDALSGIGEQTSRLRRRTSKIAGQARAKVMPIRKTR